VHVPPESGICDEKLRTASQQCRTAQIAGGALSCDLNEQQELTDARGFHRAITVAAGQFATRGISNGHCPLDIGARTEDIVD
jgi:hypothetical protein